MGEMAAHNNEAPGLDWLVETDSKILDQVRKDLSEEYSRFMGRLLMERIASQAAGGASMFERLSKAASTPPAQDRSS
jgi:hypothetical protein